MAFVVGEEKKLLDVLEERNSFERFIVTVKHWTQLSTNQKFIHEL